MFSYRIYPIIPKFGTYYFEAIYETSPFVLKKRLVNSVIISLALGISL